MSDDNKDSDELKKLNFFWEAPDCNSNLYKLYETIKILTILF